MFEIGLRCLTYGMCIIQKYFVHNKTTELVMRLTLDRKNWIFGHEFWEDLWNIMQLSDRLTFVV